MLRKKNIEIFALLAIMFYGHISAIYASELENIQILLNKSMREELNEREKKIYTDIAALDNITTILSDENINGALEIQYRTFCDVKNNRCNGIESKLNSEEDLMWVRDTIFKANEICYDAATNCLQNSINIISVACSKNREEVRTINKSVATVINNSSEVYERVKRYNKVVLSILTKVADTCNYIGLGGLVEKLCKRLEYPNPLKVARNKIDMLSNEMTDFEGYKKSCSNAKLSLYKKTDEVLKSINLEETRLLQKALMNYRDIEDDQYRDLIAKVRNKQMNSDNNATVTYEESEQMNSHNNTSLIKRVNGLQTKPLNNLLSGGCVLGVSYFIANKVSQKLGFEDAKFAKGVLALWLFYIGMVIANL